MLQRTGQQVVSVLKTLVQQKLGSGGQRVLNKMLMYCSFRDLNQQRHDVTANDAVPLVSTAPGRKTKDNSSFQDKNA